MKIRDLINERYEYRWDVIESIPEFAVLKTCEQNPRWHSEGNAWEHTKRVCATAKDIIVSFSDKENSIMNEIFLAAALFHDIGKGVTTKMGRDGNWHSYGHELESEKITRYLLWDENILRRESVCALVRWHMEPLHIFKHKEWLTEILDISREVIWADLINLSWCDREGSIKSEEEKKNSLDGEKIFTLVDVCNKLNCYRKPSEIPTDKRDLTCEQVRRDKELGKAITVTILIGLCGAGKSTYAEKIKDDNTIILSRDTIRAELGFCGDGEKVVLSLNKEKLVTQVLEKKLVEAAKQGKHIILDNLNLKKAYRDEYKRILKDFNVFWDYVYIEAPTLQDNAKRREGVVPMDTLKEMLFKLEWPTYNEYDSFQCFKDGALQYSKKI